MENPEAKPTPTKTRKIQKIFLLFLSFVAMGLFAVGAKGIIDRRKAVTKVSQSPILDQVVTEDTDSPDETKPMTAYEVPADQPRRIIIATIGAEGYIQKVGTTKDNAMAVPNNINFAGWYTASVKPGSTGLSIIDGHVSGKYNDSIFKNLSKLKIGDMFEVEYGDLSLKKFEVVETKTLPEEQVSMYLFAKNDKIEKQLNLITCAGKFDKKSQTFQDRVVVVAKTLN
jgi:LPXTG-site transpeptidase (sortase) family protein